MTNCIENDEQHNFLFLRSVTREAGYHMWRHIDIFYCTKCLHKEEIERVNET